MSRNLTRRSILRGAGVALSLPFLESLAPRTARAQAAVRKRFVAVFLPNGASDNWKPTSMGEGAAWQLSGPLEPLMPFKAKTTVISGLENGWAFWPDGRSSVEPSHGRQPAAFLTCHTSGMGAMENRTSMDQTMAMDPKVGGTPIPSLQIGCSTWHSDCDQGQPCENSRSISWNAMRRPMYKSVDPLEVFNKLAGVTRPVAPGSPMMTGPSPADLRRVALNKSVLDVVLDNANRTRAKLGATDRAKVDAFLGYVREVEKRATTMSQGMGGVACMMIPKPTLTPVLPNGARGNTANYNKADHLDIMNDLIAMAFQCDATRVITHMLEDERSEFVYSHVSRRTWTGNTSTPAAGTCGQYHNNGQHGPQAEFAAITHFNVGKVAALCAKLEAIKEGDKTALDNTVIFFGGAMHGSNHQCNNLPVALIGKGGGELKTDQHIAYPRRWLRDLHQTVMKEVFMMSGPGVDDFGIARPNNPFMPMREILS
ncbi:MAG TPA: DUF1552 domain-containing protein [Polyangia bacterium]